LYPELSEKSSFFSNDPTAFLVSQIKRGKSFFTAGPGIVALFDFSVSLPAMPLA